MTPQRQLGHGIGLRREHFAHLLERAGEGLGVDFFEIISENFLVEGGRPMAVLEKVRAEVPVVMHGVSLGIGGTDPLPEEYLESLKRLERRIEPALVSDHLCWGGHGGAHAHDLLPLPYTEEALAHVVERVARVQDRLGRQILLENVSSYVTFRASEMPEWAFLAEVAERADCGILLDVNNVFVSSKNHGFSVDAYLEGIPASRVGQLHLAGHTDAGTHLLDTHVGPVPDPVWALCEKALTRFGAVPMLVEWDTDVPPYEVVVAEAKKAAGLARALSEPRLG